RDLRISVTDRCNFRCTYCMPAEGMTWLDRAEVLTYEEIERVARICVERFGVDSLRLTGGEPTVRAHLPLLISRLAALRLADGRTPDLALTTNGATLRNIAGELRDAGLARINVSLDTLRRDRFLAMTRRDELDNVLAGIAEAKTVGFDPVKVNAVIERGANDDEILDLARWGRDNGRGALHRVHAA
ncbi:MAG: molybdenum cofactor biosynthesis protein MoaA, partial [Actinomycetota bacterium]